MATVEPVPDEPAAVVTYTRGDAAATGSGDDGRDGRDVAGSDTGPGSRERALVIADYHAGIEAGLRYERGVELESRAEERRERVRRLLDRTAPDRLVVLGDLAHRIGDPGGVEDEELTALVDVVTGRVPMTLVRGNHDGGLEEAFGDRVEVTPGDGVRLGDAGFCHGHTWPSRAVLGADVVCVGHEHPAVRLTDEVGGGRVERAWLRGPLRPEPFAERFGVDVADLDWHDPELVVFPAFNDRSGGTWVNVEGQGFLSPFLPAALDAAEAYLLDGTRLGDYRRV